VHVFVVQVDQIAKRANVARRAWLGRSVAVDVALHFKRPFFAVLAPSERLGHITGLAADLDAPVSRCQLSEGRHACALQLSCARRVHREIKKDLIIANVSRPCEMGLGRLGLAEEHDRWFRAQGDWVSADDQYQLLEVKSVTLHRASRSPAGQT
jgi:hypothetical protein